MSYFDQVNGIMHRNNEEIKGKIALQEQVIQFRVDMARCTSKDQTIKLLEEKDESNEELIKSLKQQIALTKSVDKQLIDLKKNELENKNQKIRQLEERLRQLEVQNTESMTAVLEELRKQKGAIDQVSINMCGKQIRKIKELEMKASADIEKVARCEMEVKSQQEQITALNAKLISETQKVTNLEQQLQNQINITVAKNQKILQLETEVSKTVDKLKKMEGCRNSIGANSVVHNVTLSNNYTFEALVLDTSDNVCPGWTIIQQRIHGGVDFNRSWEEYKNGFGDFWEGDFFLGLEKIHRLTTEQPHELYIQMRKFDGTTFMARFEAFAISGENSGFRLSTLGAFSGNTTDEFSYSKNMKFSTYDRDNDQDLYKKKHCALKHHGGWWYNNCAYR